MKGDFSRISFNSRKHYSGVLQQQGRAQLDADWNEQVEIDAHRARALARDVIGACGAPRSDAGFEISVRDDGEIAISPGRLYAGGTLCQLEEEVTYSRQPDLPRPAPVPPVDGETYIVYLDVWERHVTAVEDPDIREPALGGPDTTTRSRTVAQVKLLPDVVASDCEERIDGWPPAPSSGRLAASVRFTGSENRLYRVEIHEPGPLGSATFKWSRDNGSTVLAVKELLESERGLTPAQVESLGSGERLDLRQGDWVELTGEESDLSLLAGRLVQVAEVQEEERIVWLEGDLSHHREESRPKLRRWDGKAGAQPADRGWLELEDGVSVEFSDGPFAAGDWWVLPARPGGESVERAPEPPRGIRHDYCKLALLTWEKQPDGRWGASIRDCRPLFEPLAGGHERCAGEIADLHALLESQARELAELRERLPR